MLVAAVVVVPLALLAYGLSVYAGHDRIELIDLPEVQAAAEAGCADVEATLSRDHESRAAAVAAGNAAIEGLISRVRALGTRTLEDDLPAQSWLRDWEALAASRSELGRRLAGDPAAQLQVPQTEDGRPITGRMSWALESCERAVGLAARP